MHIEQARVLQDTGNRIGLVTAIAGYVHADVDRRTAAATTRARRRWTSGSTPALVLAESILELERLARAAGQGTVGTVGEIEVDPGLINAIAERVRFSLDIRGPRRGRLPRRRARDRAPSSQQAAEQRGMTAEYRERQTLAADAAGRRASSARSKRPPRRRASRSCGCTPARRTTRCASPTASRARWSSSPAGTGSATRRSRTPTRPTPALAAEIILNAIRALGLTPVARVCRAALDPAP